MTKLEYNGKVITENYLVASVLMAFGIMLFPLIAVGFMTIFGEGLAYLFPGWFEPKLILSVFTEMWMGGVLTLMGFFMVFGKKGNSFGVNIPSLDNQEVR